MMLQEIVVDNFAGGGGASTGIERALGRPIDIAVNHDPDAIRMHTVNHPQTKHLCESVWKINPMIECAGRPVGLAWFSPDCKHFSKAKGTKPVSKNIRGLAKGDNIGQDIRTPLQTVTAGGYHFGEVRAFLMKYYGNEREGIGIKEPLHTVTTKDRFGLVTVKNEDIRLSISASAC